MRKTLKRTLALLLAVLLLCGGMTAAFAEDGEIVSGYCGAEGDGSNVTWELNTDTGEMTIRGAGEMRNYMRLDDVPWHSYHNGTICTVTIETGVTSICNGAFYYCSSLTSVTIPDSVTSIGEGAFENCGSLTAFSVDAQNVNYCSDADGVLYNKNKTKLIQYPIGNPRTSFTIPDSVTSIGDFAFYYCTSLTSITIPGSVTRIGGHAFYNCSGLTSITIPGSVTSIGDYAFSNCGGLTSATIGNGVTDIGSGAFSGCSGLTSITIGNGVTGIGAYAFSGCSSLTGITIPGSVTSIGDYVFSECRGLKRIDAAENNPNYCSAAGILYNKTMSELIAYPGGITGGFVLPDSVTSIGVSAFSDCGGLTGITIPDGMTSICDYAFSSFSGMTSITR
ncbi:MAG: leucine-rich repeat domain-containing protein, partial [Clostridia bacterium]|nr:leucine-rich repeat domain-containing protein [Clostridia bacterium]